MRTDVGTAQHDITAMTNAVDTLEDQQRVAFDTLEHMLKHLGGNSLCATLPVAPDRPLFCEIANSDIKVTTTDADGHDQLAEALAIHGTLYSCIAMLAVHCNDIVSLLYGWYVLLCYGKNEGMALVSIKDRNTPILTE